MCRWMDGQEVPARFAREEVLNTRARMWRNRGGGETSISATATMAFEPQGRWATGLSFGSEGYARG